MKISRKWLQTYFDKELPDADALAHALTFHVFEIESVDPSTSLGAGNDTILDVKVTPNRGHDCLSYRGIAKEISAILDIPLKSDPLSLDKALKSDHPTDAVAVSIEEPDLCRRFTAAYIKGVKVGPSPDWLVKRLSAMGQHSINNVVDATNYVMFDLGQPLHAFDAGKLQGKGQKAKGKSEYAIQVRKAADGEKIIALDDKEYTLKSSMLVVVDANAGVPVGIAGVKGGKPAGISEATKDIILEAANFSGVSVRKTAHALKLRTDASSRFEQEISPELAGYGMRAAAELIQELAGGELVGFVDEYPRKQEKKSVSVSRAKINSVLGTTLSIDDVGSALVRLGLAPSQQRDTLVVEAPFERLDLNIPEDLVEEVGRIVGYEKVEAKELPPLDVQPEINWNFYAGEVAREELIAQGYSEVFTSVFADKGERAVANKVDGAKPYLRATLADGLQDAYERNMRNRDLLGLTEVKLFEIGSIWKGGKEEIVLGTADKKGVKETALKSGKADAYESLPISETERYQSFSKYPAISRDIALWVYPEQGRGVPTADEVFSVIKSHAGTLLVKSWKFDEFAKGEKISYAFRLVFQSFDRTLLDEDANSHMESIYSAVKEKGWEVR